MRTSTRIEGDSRFLTQNELELQKQCQECADLADDMMKRFERLTVSPRTGKAWRSIVASFRSTWAKKDLEILEVRLAKYRDAMNSRLLGSLYDRLQQIVRQQSAQTATINSNTEKLVAGALLDIHASLTRDINKQNQLLLDLLPTLNNWQRNNDSRMLKDIRYRSGTYVDTNADAERYLEIQREEAQIQKRIKNRILESITYDKIHGRYQAIGEAHEKTLQWVLEPQTAASASQWSTLTEWLQAGEGAEGKIYWVSGKAGSGKSTLMKYIYENPLTRDHLLMWAKDTPLYIASFFFHSGGTRVQRSQEGLFRSVLHSVLHEIPALIPHVFPSQWAKFYTSETKLQTSGGLQPFGLNVLIRAFKRLISVKEMPVKVCLFIDGLDEYDGAEFEMVDLFQNLALSPQVKICLSSRPLIEFEDAFRNCTSLELQNLTRDDIRQYVHDRMGQNERILGLLKTVEDRNRWNELQEEITQSAQGVFLWVTLVVSSLLNGLGKHDSIEDLHRRLRALPSKLEDLYRDMIIKPEGLYAQEASRLFQLIAAATEEPDDWKPVHLLSMQSLHLALQEDILAGYSLDQRAKLLKIHSTVMENCRKTAVLLKTRCGGLLEVQHQGMKYLSPNMKISYLHRTVKDFLETQDIKDFLASRTGGVEKDAYEPNVAILKSYMFQGGTCDPSSATDNEHVAQALTYAGRVDKNHHLLPTQRVKLFESFPRPASWQSLVPFATIWGWRGYLGAKVELDPSVLEGHFTRSLLEYALFPDMFPESLQRHLRAGIVSFLLKLGGNPDKVVGNQTLWQLVLSHSLVALRIPPGNLDRMYSGDWYLIVKAFLQSGADPHATVQIDSEIWNVSDVIHNAFKHTPVHEHQLQAILADKQLSIKSWVQVLIAWLFMRCMEFWKFLFLGTSGKVRLM